MKRVFNTSEIAHIWAHQQQDEARNQGGNLYFEGPIIYSYGRHFPIAAISKKDSNVVYFTTDSYSQTTAKHVDYTLQAINHKTIIYCANPDNAYNETHYRNLEDFENRAKHIARNLPTSRKPEIYLRQIAGVRSQFETYVNHFKIKKSKYKSFVFLFIESKDGGTKATDKERKAIERQRKADEKRTKEQHAKDLQRFRDFEVKRMWTCSNRDYLRYNSETNRIETSQGIEIPVKIAESFYKWVKTTVKNGGCDGNCEMKIMDFNVQIVNSDFIKIGCHVITSDEYERIATQLGWNK